MQPGAKLVLVAVEPRLLREALSIALRGRGGFDVVDVVDVIDLTDSATAGAIEVDAAIVTGPSSRSISAPIVLEFPDQDQWTGSAVLAVGGDRRTVAVPTLEAVASVLETGMAELGERAAPGRSRRSPRGQAKAPDQPDPS